MSYHRTGLVGDASALIDASGVRREIETLATNGILIAGSTLIISKTGNALGSVLAWSTGTSAWEDSSRAWASGPTTSTGMLLENTTAAALGAQQVGPAYVTCGRGWETTGGTSQSVAGYWDILPVQGATASGTMQWKFKIGAAAIGSPQLSLTSAGALTIASGFGLNAATSTWLTSSYLRVGANCLLALYDRSTGLGTCWELMTDSAAYPLLLHHNARTDGANNVVCATVWKKSSITDPGPGTNEATMRLHQFSVSYSAATNYERAAVYVDGRVKGVTLSASGDVGGLATMTSLSNVTLAAGANLATLINVPGAGAAAQVGWIKIYVGATAYAVPYWAAA